MTTAAGIPKGWMSMLSRRGMMEAAGGVDKGTAQARKEERSVAARSDASAVDARAISVVTVRRSAKRSER